VELEWVREYAYVLKKEDEDESKKKGQAYCIAVDGKTACFNPINSRIALTRKNYRSKAARPSQIHLSRRALDEVETKEQGERKELLMKRVLALTDQSASQPAAAADDGDAAEEQPPAARSARGTEDAYAAAFAAAYGAQEDDDDDEEMMVEDEDDDL